MKQFVKIYGSIIRSTVWQGPPHVRLVWLTLLILADSEGRVEGSIPGLAHTAGVTIDECEQALAAFLAPDKYSRTKDFDGRRLEEIDGGWVVLNHNKYRDMRSPTQAAQAERQRRYRKRQKEQGKSPSRKKKAATAPAADVADGVTRDVTPVTRYAGDGAQDEKRHSLRVSRADPDPDPDPDLEPIPTDRVRSKDLVGSARAARPEPAPPAALAPSPESRDDAARFADVTPTSKVPPDYVSLERHGVTAAELGLDLDAEVARFRTHEYPRPFSDFHSRFDRWLLDARKFAETEAFKAQQRGGGARKPRAGILQTQPAHGVTGWEEPDDDGRETSRPSPVTRVTPPLAKAVGRD